MSRNVRLTVHAALATALTAVALHALFVSGDWFWATIGGVVVAAGACQLGRHLSLPAPVCSLVGLAALLWYLTVVFAGSEATFRVIPDPSALGHLAELTRTGFQDIAQYTAPVPSLTGVNLVTAGGIGVMAVLVDLLAVGMRRPAMAGLALLAIFSTPVAIRLDGIGWLAFVAAAAGFLGLLLADGRERLSRWGHPVLARRGRGRRSANRPTLPDAGPLSATGRRIGLLAVLIALVLPIFVPDLPARAFLGTGGFGGVGGTNTIAAPSPIVGLKRDLALPQNYEVLRYRTDDRSPEYLRIYALDSFDGQEWRMSRVRAGPDDRVAGQEFSVPGQSDNVPAQPVTTEVSISPDLKDVKFLPLPYPTSRVEIRGDWRVDRDTLMVFSTNDVATGRTYRVTSLDVDTTRQRLRNAPRAPEDVRERYLEVPNNVPREVLELAHRVTNDATTSYDEAVALQEWFTSGEFTYSLEPQGNSTSALTDFLLRSKTGYCEQFAFSMALLARILDVPARVAVGYTAGTSQGDEWVVTTHDAHAWPELYFHGVGWVRFEPTPAGAAGQSTASVPEYAEEPVAPGPAGGSGAANNQPSAAGDDTPEQTSTAGPTAGLDGGAPNLGGGSASPGAASRPWAPLGLAAAAVVAVMLAMPAVARWVVRRRRWSTARNDSRRAGAAWLELRDGAIDLGLPWRPSDSPRAAARRLREHLVLSSVAAEALARVTSAEERARYAPTTPATHGLVEDVETVRRAMLGAVSPYVRWRARLLPPSIFEAVRNAGRTALDRVEGLRTRARARLLPRSLGGGTSAG